MIDTDQTELHFEDRTKTIEERVKEYHAANPEVYTQLCALARSFISKHPGRKVGIGMLWEVLRWNYYMATDDPNSSFKLNNTYRSRYARMIEKREPDLKGRFELRELQTP